MRVAQGTAYSEFLAYHLRTFRTVDFQILDATGRASVKGFKREDVTEIDARAAADKFRKFCGVVSHAPVVEVPRLHVIVVEHLRENLRVLAVAEAVLHALKVREVLVFPAGAVKFRAAAAALGIAGVAKLASIAENLPPGLVYCAADILPHCHGKSLIPLAMVVSAYIEVAVRRRPACFSFFHSGLQPAARDDCVGLEEFKRRR